MNDLNAVLQQLDAPADTRLTPLVALRKLLPFAEGDEADRKLLRRLDIEQAVKR
jgi:hypothetical protein